jgi:hypothetical protein
MRNAAKKIVARFAAGPQACQGGRRGGLHDSNKRGKPAIRYCGPTLGAAVGAPRDHRLSDLDRARIGWLPSLARFLARWSTWIRQLRGRRTRTTAPASWPADNCSSRTANPRQIGLPQGPLPTRNSAQTVRLADQPASLGKEPQEANRADVPAPTANADTNAVPDASSAPPPPTLGVSAPVRPSEEGSQADQSAAPSAGEAASESREAAPPAADFEAVPDLLTDSDGPTATFSPGATNFDAPEAPSAGEAPDAENQGSPAETVVERAEARSATTEIAAAGTSSREARTPAATDNDAAPAVDTIDDADCNPLADLIGPEISAGEDILPAPNEPQPEASASILRPVSTYRPRLGPRPAPSPRPAAPESEQERTGGSLEAILLLTFLPGDWGISLAVLLGRADGMPENLEVRVGGTTYSLLAIDARLFEPFEPPGEIDFVGDGFAAEAATPPARRWVRTKRDLHVFSERAGVSGFASVPRALIGQENVILCRAHLAATVFDCARATGSPELQQVAGPGIPEGWQCFRAFRPKAPADFGEASDIFLSLNPLPDAAIELSGGIASGRSTWIIGAPPTIRILGIDPSAAEFTIDGQSASPAQSDGWLAPGWDAPGTHTIRFGGLSRTYDIVEIEETWPTWATDNASAYFACGAKVSASARLAAFAFASGPCWLLGACADDVAFAARSSAGIAIAAPPFRPVWALAARAGGRLLPATALPFRAPPRMPYGPIAREQIMQWCNLLRGSAAPAEVNSKELWRQYRQLARRLRRRGR